MPHTRCLHLLFQTSCFSVGDTQKPSRTKRCKFCMCLDSPALPSSLIWFYQSSKYITYNCPQPLLCTHVVWDPLTVPLENACIWVLLGVGDKKLLHGRPGQLCINSVLPSCKGLVPPVSRHCLLIGILQIERRRSLLLWFCKSLCCLHSQSPSYPSLTHSSERYSE